MLGREDDRRRIRRDLHDGLGPVLGGVALRLQAAGNAIDTDPARARELVALARTEVSDALDDVRRLVHDLRPPALDDLGLEAAVRQQADRVRSEVDVDVTADGATGLPAAVEVAAYRIVSEALANVVKHAGARHVDVRLEGDAGALTVTVADDGRGIGPDVTAGVGPAVAARARRGARRPLRGRVPGVRRHDRARGPAVRRRRGRHRPAAGPPTTTSSLRPTEPVRSTR